MSILVLSDTHITDRLDDEYRWQVFSEIKRLAKKHSATQVYHLGDLTDRKDRHSAALVNRLIDEFQLLSIGAQIRVTILCGNHDTPMLGTPYWSFLGNVSSMNVQFIVEPTMLRNGTWFLPFNPKPNEAWTALDFSKSKAAFVHQTFSGTVGENGHEIRAMNAPKFPAKMKVYAGDAHVPQKVGQITYVGAPHPIRFGDDYASRMLVLDEETYSVVAEEPLSYARKRTISIISVDELDRLQVSDGDTIKLRMEISSADVGQWNGRQAAILARCSALGLDVASVEPVISQDGRSASEGDLEGMSDADVLREFGAFEKLDPAMLKAGLALFNGSRK